MIPHFQYDNGPFLHEARRGFLCCFCTPVSKERAKVRCSSWEPGHPSRVVSFTPVSAGSLEREFLAPLFGETLL